MGISEAYLRRHAVQIAAQLPEGREDALAVLSFASEIVERFLSASPPAAPPDLMPTSSEQRGSLLRLVP